MTHISKRTVEFAESVLGHVGTVGGASLKQLVEYDLEGGGKVYVEVDDEDSTLDYVRAATGGELAGKASATLDQALGVISDTASKVVAQVQAIKSGQATMSSVEVEFGVKLAGKVGAVIASSEAEVHFQVKLVWTPG
jgi:hypothetical protein